MPKIGKSLNMTFFANQQLKPKTVTWKGGIVDAYPLYAFLIYGRATATIKVERQGSPILVSPGLEQLSEPELHQFIEEFKKYVFGIVKKEIDLYGEKFSLMGIAGRLKKYENRISEIIGGITIDKAISPILAKLNLNPESDEGKRGFRLAFYTLLAFLDVPALKKMTVYDWVFNDGRDVVKEILLKSDLQVNKDTYQFTELEINTIVDTLDTHFR
jgi:hypothetical protein